MAPRRLALVAITLAAAGLRFSTLDLQSFWLDETLTTNHVGRSFGDMLAQVREEEYNPPLYFALAWAWAKVFGTGEAGLRSLSALLGTATVPVAYVAAARLVSARVGLVVAALAAANPLLVWYSQEARAYALLALLCAASFAFFAEALHAPGVRAVAFWAVTSVLALVTHYFAVFLVAVEAVWLLAARGSRRAVLVAVGASAAAGAAILPVAIAQAREFYDRWAASDPGSIPTATVADVAKKFLIGESGFGPIGNHARLALVLVGAGILLLALRANARERRGALVALAVGGIAAALPVVLAVAGFDVLNARNLIEVWVPLTVVYATGYGARQAGLAGLLVGAVLLALFAATTINVFVDERAQRHDWRQLASVLREPVRMRLIVVTPAYNRFPIEHYVPSARPAAARAPTAEIDVVQPRDASLPQRLAGTASTSVEVVQRLRLVRFRLRRARPLGSGELERALATRSFLMYRG